MSGRYVPQCLVGMLFLANQFNMCLVGILFGIKYQYAIKFISANKSHWSSLNIDVLLYFFLSSSSSFQCLASKERFFSLSLSLSQWWIFSPPDPTRNFFFRNLRRIFFCSILFSSTFWWAGTKLWLHLVAVHDGGETEMMMRRLIKKTFSATFHRCPLGLQFFCMLEIWETVFFKVDFSQLRQKFPFSCYVQWTPHSTYM